MLNYKFLEKGIDSKISIFKILIIGKILLIPFILFLASKYDPRPFNILILPDLISYEKIASIKDFLVTVVSTIRIPFRSTRTTSPTTRTRHVDQVPSAA